MKKIEATSLLVITFLLIYRVFVGMEVHVFLRVLLTLLAIFYLWFGFFLFNRLGFKDLLKKKEIRKVSAMRVVSSIVAGLLYSFSLIALMFAVNFYQGMQGMMLLALILNLSMLALSVLFFAFYKKDKRYYRQYILRSSVLALVFMAFLFTPVEKRLVRLFQEYPGFIEAYKEYWEEPGNQEKLEKLKEERSAIR